MKEPPKVEEANGRVAWHNFGGVLQHIRLRQGLSQERFAQLLACDRTYIWRLEHNRNRPSRMFLHNLMMTCKLTVEDTTMLVNYLRLREYDRDELAMGEADFNT